MVNATSTVVAPAVVKFSDVNIVPDRGSLHDGWRELDKANDDYYSLANRKCSDFQMCPSCSAVFNRVGSGKAVCPMCGCVENQVITIKGKTKTATLQDNLSAVSVRNWLDSFRNVLMQKDEDVAVYAIAA